MQNRSSIFSFPNPKLSMSATRFGEIYPYYAGFSAVFAEALIKSAISRSDAHILDPWNGSGTTTISAARLDFPTSGFDLNPAMFLVAKARLLSKMEAPSLGAICAAIIGQAKVSKECFDTSEDPLSSWFMGETVKNIRRLEKEIQRLLVDCRVYKRLAEYEDLCRFSDMACFFYVALFRTARKALAPFRTSNPTWIRRPKRDSDRIKKGMDPLIEEFRAEVRQMETILDSSASSLERSKDINLGIASSEALPMPSASVNFVLSSPPYCTRIDYAIATLPELAIMGYTEVEVNRMRRTLIGSPTKPDSPLEQRPEWGKECNRLLRRIRGHKSRASDSYYYDNHCQYFGRVYNSLGEIYRVLESSGLCCLVVQDSYYKDIHNNLPDIFVEMSKNLGLVLVARSDFVAGRTMAAINPAVRPYRTNPSANESVLCFAKT